MLYIKEVQMKRKGILFFVIPFFIFFYYLYGYGGQSQPTAITDTIGAKTGTPSKKPAKAVWEEHWGEVLREAQKEGKLVVLTAASSNARKEMNQVFKKKTGLTLEWIAGRPAELIEKLRRERAAGIYSTDIYYGSSGPVINLWKPEGMLDTLSPLLLLPEVIDKQVWYGAKLRF